MSKLFTFEMVMRDIIYMTRIKTPYGLDYDNPYNSISFKKSLNATTDISVTYDFYVFGDDDYFNVTIFIGSRCYIGLFFKKDYEFIKHLVDKFISLNI